LDAWKILGEQGVPNARVRTVGSLGGAGDRMCDQGCCVNGGLPGIRRRDGAKDQTIADFSAACTDLPDVITSRPWD
jgi:hypothetical protein